MNVDRPARKFAGAFIDGFAAMADLHNIMVIASHADLDAVDFKFNIGGGAFRGYAHDAGISVAAMWGAVLGCHARSGPRSRARA